MLTKVCVGSQVGEMLVQLCMHRLLACAAFCVKALFNVFIFYGWFCRILCFFVCLCVKPVFHSSSVFEARRGNPEFSF